MRFEMLSKVAVLIFVLGYATNVDGCQTCSMSKWHQWKTCSQSCGGGVRTRKRSLCCPIGVSYDTCLSDLCHDIVTYNDTLMTDQCNTECFNGGVFDGVCVCPPGWTGTCCNIPCGDQTHGINCTQSCKCGNNSTCDQVTGQCFPKDTFGINKGGLACRLCEVGSWERWSTCDQQCGGGVRTRYKEICCPGDTQDYETCMNTTCKYMSYEDVKQEESCNTNCYNGGLFTEHCHCGPGWTGRCCQTMCIMASCNACNQCSSWMSWGTCSHRCGGGVQRRIGYTCCVNDQSCMHSCNSNGKMIFQNRPCNKICENGGTFDTGACVCLVGFRGRCCQLDCDDGYYGDHCNVTCNCLSAAKCDKVTGECLVVDVGSNSSPQRLYIIIGVAAGAFVIVQVLIVIVVSKYTRGRREENSRNRLEKGKFWTQKDNSNPVLDTPENHYEEIPFDINGGKPMKCVDGHKKGKGSMKKASFKKSGSFRKCSEKNNETKTPKKEDMYQFLENDEDCGYQRLVDPSTIYTSICGPKLEQNNLGWYMAMKSGTSVDTNGSTELGYVQMNSQSDGVNQVIMKPDNF